MKEIETLVEEKTKESSDITKMIKDGEQAGSAKVCMPPFGQIQEDKNMK